MLQAIQTVYRGYKFRSRIEARFACFFDALNLKWQYEPEGYLLPDGTHYLPDFDIPELGWFEVKPKEPTAEELHKLGTLVVASGRNGYFLCGQIPDPNDAGRSFGYFDDFYCEQITCVEVRDFDGDKGTIREWMNSTPDVPFWFSVCGHCGKTSIFCRAIGRCPCGVDVRPNYQKISNACAVARAARFEHGERPLNP